MNSQHANKAIGIVGAVIILLQAYVRLFLPEQFWHTFQEIPEFWTSVTTLTTFILMAIFNLSSWIASIVERFLERKLK